MDNLKVSDNLFNSNYTNTDGTVANSEYTGRIVAVWLSKDEVLMVMLSNGITFHEACLERCYKQQ